MSLKFYQCRHCGNIIAHLKDSGVRVVCCGETMGELVPGTVEASTEKHIPVAEFKDGVLNVTVGSVEHPMAENHFIEWIMVEGKLGNQRKKLNPGDPPKASFNFTEGDEPVNVYALCNLHGLWKSN